MLLKSKVITSLEERHIEQNQNGKPSIRERQIKNKKLNKKQGKNQGKNQKRSMFRLFKNTQKIKLAEITLMTRQIASLVTAGIPLVQSFAMIEEITAHAPLQHLMKKIKEAIESGMCFSHALKDHPEHFDPLYCSLIEVGEHSGSLDMMLDRLATHKEKLAALTRKLKSALYYPVAVLMISIGISVILLLKVVPVFEQMFHNFSAELPLFTKLVLRISNLLQYYGIYLLAVLALVFYLCVRLYRKNISFRNTLERYALRIPIAGILLQKTMVARFSRTLAIMTKAGIPLSDALNIVSKALGNIVFTTATIQIKQGLIAGQSIHKMMKKTNVFPALVVQMIGIGEESGTLEDMLSKVAHLYEDEVASRIDGLTTLLEPVTMVIVGIFVGGLIIAMYLPIFQMGNVL